MTLIYNIKAKENLTEFYDEIELILCENNSGFGRNLDALRDLLNGGFGKLYNNKKDKIKTEIVVLKSKLLAPKIIKIFEEANIESEIYYEENNTYSYKWLTIILL